MNGTDTDRKSDLPLNMTRCHDDRCRDRMDCRRYLHRAHAGPQTQHVMSCRDPSMDFCGWRITA